MNRKALHGRATVKDATQGIAELVISAYGNVDSDADIVEQGAAAKQIAGVYGPNPKGMLDHDWSMRSAVAKTLRWWEEPDGTHVEAQYNLDKEVGRDAFSDLQFYGDDMEFSVGYEIKARRGPNEAEKAMGARQVITEWQINEWSHVMLGANSETRLVAAKADGLLAVDEIREIEAEPEVKADEPMFDPQRVREFKHLIATTR